MRPLKHGYTHTDDPACDKPSDDTRDEQPAPWLETEGLSHTQDEFEVWHMLVPRKDTP